MNAKAGDVGSEGPCTECAFKVGCPPYAVLKTNLFRAKSYRSPPAPDSIDRALDGLIGAFVVMMKEQERRNTLSVEDRGVHLSALFDLAVTAIYTNNLWKGAKEFNQEAILSGPNSAYFPYTWMDPRSLALGMPLADCYLPDSIRKENRDYPVAQRLAKPGGRFIGDGGIKVLRGIIRRILSANRPHARLRDGGGLHGEFDLTITDEDHLIFIEVKAKPLIAYPLKLSLLSTRTSDELRWQTISMSDVRSFSLFLAASNQEIALSKPSEDEFITWPLPDLERAIGDPETFLLVVNNWKKHLDGYRKWENEPRETRWHRFGCGNFGVIENKIRIEKRVANTKELPGLDRTDDIKKGAAQLIKFARYKFECAKEAIRCVLAGNTHAETHAENYIEPLINLKIVRATDPTKRTEWIFDAVIGLTKNNINNADLKMFFDLANL
jgi:hypothetical protein